MIHVGLAARHRLPPAGDPRPRTHAAHPQPTASQGRRSVVLRGVACARWTGPTGGDQSVAEAICVPWSPPAMAVRTPRSPVTKMAPARSPDDVVTATAISLTRGRVSAGGPLPKPPADVGQACTDQAGTGKRRTVRFPHRPGQPKLLQHRPESGRPTATLRSDEVTALCRIVNAQPHARCPCENHPRPL